MSSSRSHKKATISYIFFTAICHLEELNTCSKE